MKKIKSNKLFDEELLEDLILTTNLAFSSVVGVELKYVLKLIKDEQHVKQKLYKFYTVQVLP